MDGSVPPAEPTAHHRQTWKEFYRNNLSVLILLVMVALLVLGFYFMDRYWRRLQNTLEKVTGIMNQSYAYSLNLVRHFMPSFKVEKYQFRGMQAKKGTASIGFNELSLQLPNGKRILNGVTGEFLAGRMCAIMGPSGGGKTSFMNVLCGKANYGKVAGVITINGQEADISEFQSITGFVPQDDIVHQDLTVREQIMFSARLRNSVNLSESRLERITEDVLNVMQIDHIQNSIVGGVEERGISGGQRKRVNIGLELAAQPTVLFLDEPTSGLDATGALAVALSMKKLCQLGMTSIMVIHQPRYSLFTLFDDVLLLGKGGQTVYLGSSLGAKPYFESLGFTMPSNENPSDWFMDVISGEVDNPQIHNFKPEMLFDLWKTRVQRTLNGTPQESVQRERRSRDRTDHDDRAVLGQKLEEEWDRIDVNGDGVMESAELRQLLAHCSSLMPDDEVVRELMDRMAGPGAVEVTRKQFTDYLCSLSGDVADDQTLAPLDAQGLTGPHRRAPSMQLEDLSPRTSADSEGSADVERGPDSEGRPRPLAAALQRKMPGFSHQLYILTLRRLVQWWRMNRQRAIFLTALTLGALVLAALDRYIVETPAWGGMALLNLHTALALLLAIFCLQVFGNDQPVFWREKSRGVNILAYYEARLCVNTFDIIVQTFLFTCVYFIIRQPGLPFWRFFIPFALTSYAASGWGYLVSTLVPPKQGPFVVSLVIFVICGLLGNPTNLGNFLRGGVVEVVVSALSITRWSVAMSSYLAISYLNPQPTDVRSKAMLHIEKEVFFKRDWGVGLWWTPALALVIIGSVLRVAAFLGLWLSSRHKQV